MTPETSSCLVPTMRETIDRVLSVLLVAACAGMALTLVHREFFVAPVVSPSARGSEFLPKWRDIVQQGRLIGQADAPVVIVEFTDLQCPFCRTFNRTLQGIRQKFNEKVSYVFVHTPLPGHRFAQQAARAAECANQSGRFLEALDAMFDDQAAFGTKPWGSYALTAGIADTARFARCIADTTELPIVKAGLEAAQRFEIRATPTVILNGWRYGSAPSDTELSRAINDLLAGRRPYAGFPKSALRLASH